MSGKINFELADDLARVTLNYPQRLNAMSRAMWRELKCIFEEIQQRSEVRCVLVLGQGEHFCAGGDISEYASFRFDASSLREFHENDVWGALAAMLACDVPMLAQIAGNCMGAGIEIASCCDLRIAADSAQFGAPIGRLGFPMAPREAALVARELGALSTRQMLLEAAILSAPELAQRGFLTRVVRAQELAQQAQASVQRVLALAPGAARMNKQTLRLLHTLPTAGAASTGNRFASRAALDVLLAQAYNYADGAEQHEGIEAFLAKRPAVFRTS